MCCEIEKLHNLLVSTFLLKFDNRIFYLLSEMVSEFTYHFTEGFKIETMYSVMGEKSLFVFLISISDNTEGKVYFYLL